MEVFIEFILICFCMTIIISVELSIRGYGNHQNLELLCLSLYAIVVPYKDILYLILA